MLIDENELNKRLNNPLNLMNRMRDGLTVSPKRNAMALFVPPSVDKERVEKNSDPVKVSFSSPFGSREKSNGNQTSSLPVKASPQLPSNTSESPSLDTLVDDADAKVKLATAHDSALDLLTSSLSKLQGKINNDEIKASSIPAVIASASKVITEIRKERLEREKNKGGDADVHYHFYCPEPRKIETYEVIEVTG